MVVDIDAFVFFFRFLLLPASVRCFGLTVYKEEGDVVVLATGKKLDTNMICVERFVGVNNGFVFRFGLVCLCSFAHWHFSRPTCVAEEPSGVGVISSCWWSSSRRSHYFDSNSIIPTTYSYVMLYYCSLRRTLINLAFAFGFLPLSFTRGFPPATPPYRM